MSDDTPTQRFDPTGDAPTERFTPPATEAAEPEERKSRRLLIVLSSIGGALLLAVLILLIVLLTRGTGAPVASPSPTVSTSPSATPTTSASPAPTPTPTQTEPAPPPPDTSATVTAFASTNQNVTCNASAPAGAPQYIGFSWSTTNAQQIYFGVDTNDASTAPLFDNLPPSGDTSNFPSGYDPFEYACFNASHTYTLTAVGSDGSKDSSTVTVINNGDVQ